MYFVQIGKYGINWEPVEEEEEEVSLVLQDYIDIATSLELHDGRYHARVIDDKGKVYVEIAEPYSGVRVNILKPNLDAIRADYSIDEEVFAEACQRWLEAYKNYKKTTEG